MKKVKNKNLILGLLVLVALVSGVSAWNFVTNDYGTTYGKEAMDLDSNGNPCFAYYDSVYTGDIWYECWNGGTNFDSYLVLENDSVGGFYSATPIQSISVAVDNSNVGHIVVAYRNITSSDSYHIVYFNTATGNLTNLGNTGYFGGFKGTVTIDKNNNPHVVYAEAGLCSTNYLTLREKYYNGASWITSTIDTSAGGCDEIKSPDMIITSNDVKIIQLKSIIYNASGLSSTSWSRNVTALYHSTGSTADVGGIDIYNDLLYTAYINSGGDEYIKRQNTTTEWKFEQLYTPAVLPTSLKVYNGNIYAVYISGGNEHLITNETGSFQDTTEFGDASGTSSLKIDQDNGDKWILYTDSGVVKLAYEKPLYTISGNIYDYVTTDTIENAYICYTADSTDYCDYTNSTGGYEIDLFSGTYALNITKTGYIDYPPTDIGITKSEDLSYYLTPEGYEGIADNQTVVTLTFIDYDEGGFITSEPIQFDYVDGYPCLVGKPPHIYTTDDNGQINRELIKGTYLLTSLNGYLFYWDSDGKFYNEFRIFVEDSTYNRVFFMRKINNSYSMEGVVVDSEHPDSIKIANATILFYNDEYSYSTLSDDYGTYSVNNIQLGYYNGVCIADDYLNSYFVNQPIPCTCYGDVICTCIRNFLMVNSTEPTYYTNGTIRDVLTDTGIPDVKITVFPETFETIKNTTTDANGRYFLSNLTSGKYLMKLEKDNYELYCDPYYIDICETINGIKYWKFPINHADYPGQDVLMINKTQINYYCLYGNVTWNATPIKNAYVEVIPLFSSGEEGYFNKKYQFTNSTGGYEICGLREEHKFSVKIVKEGYQTTGDTFVMPYSDYNRNAELTKEYLTVTMDFKTTACDNGQPIPCTINLYKNYTNGSLSELIYSFSTDAEFGWKNDIELLTGDYWVKIIPKVSGYGEFSPEELTLFASTSKEYCLYRTSQFYSLYIYYYEVGTTTPISDVKTEITSIDDSHVYTDFSSSIDGSVLFVLPEGQYQILATKTGYLDYIYEIGGSQAFTLNMNATISMELPKDTGYNTRLNETNVKQQEATASLDIRNTLITLVPSLFGLMLIMFFLSALTSINKH